MENENLNPQNVSASPEDSIPAEAVEAKKASENKDKLSKNTVVLICITAVLALILAGLVVTACYLHKMMNSAQEPSTEPSTNQQVPESDPPAVDDPQPEKEWVMLPRMAELYEQNPDVTGWITVPNTKIDYPVMYTPEDEEKYMRKGFDGNYHISGLPLIDKDCTMDPDEESKSLIIYGHNMGNGTAFGQLKKYADEEFWKENPYISFCTLYEERVYEVVAAFYDRVYYNYEDVFKFYFFVDPETAEEYEEANAQYKAKAEYDTGIDIKDGDRLITLVTCSYHTQDGRFVVVARQVTEDELAKRLIESQT